MTASFGRPAPWQSGDPDSPEQTPTPVLHVGEVHAELRLVVTDETLRQLGSQIASMVANATKQGFECGLAAALGENDDGPGEPAGFAAGAADLPVTDGELRRARGE